jgi:hypothetical protein
MRMALVKMTFSLDTETVARPRSAADRVAGGWSYTIRRRLM